MTTTRRHRQEQGQRKTQGKGKQRHLDGSLEGWLLGILSLPLGWTLGLVHLSFPEKQWLDVGQQLTPCQLPVGLG